MRFKNYIVSRSLTLPAQGGGGRAIAFHRVKNYNIHIYDKI